MSCPVFVRYLDVNYMFVTYPALYELGYLTKWFEHQT